MSQFSEKTSLYEVIIRVREDGGFGAHYQSITRFSRDGEVVSAQTSPLIPLTTADMQAGIILSDILGESLAQAIFANQGLSMALEEAQQATAERDQRIKDFEQQLSQVSVGSVR